MVLVRLATFAVCLLLAAFAAACASSGAVPRPFPGGPTPPTPAPGAPATPESPEAPAPEAPAAAVPRAFDARSVVETALGLRGVPYHNGGSDPSGFDCSGLVQYAFAQHGVALPREVREQYERGAEIRLAGIEPGDLLFFRTTSEPLGSARGRAASHVGIAIGGDEFVHAPSSRGVVRVERFSAPYWANRIVGVRRILESRF